MDTLEVQHNQPITLFAPNGQEMYRLWFLVRPDGSWANLDITPVKGLDVNTGGRNHDGNPGEGTIKADTIYVEVRSNGE